MRFAVDDIVDLERFSEIELRLSKYAAGRDFEIQDAIKHCDTYKFYCLRLVLILRY